MYVIYKETEYYDDHVKPITAHRLRVLLKEDARLTSEHVYKHKAIRATRFGAVRQPV